MPQSRIRYIFTYGTLMSSCIAAQGSKERGLLARAARRVGAAAVRGRLFEAGACPAAIREAGPHERIQGEVWHMTGDAAGLLDALDLYEGCGKLSPRPYPYRRTRVRLRLEDGRRVTAWMYLWSLPTEALVAVKDGRWQEPICPAIRSAACAVEGLDRLKRGRAPAGVLPSARSGRRSA